MKSIIQSEDECYICRLIYKVGTPASDTHHVLHGNGLRELADSDGLTVKLCRYHHDRLHNKNEFDKTLQIIGQKKYIEKLIFEGMTEEEARERFRARYGKFYE